MEIPVRIEIVNASFEILPFEEALERDFTGYHTGSIRLDNTGRIDPEQSDILPFVLVATYDESKDKGGVGSLGVVHFYRRADWAFDHIDVYIDWFLRKSSGHTRMAFAGTEAGQKFAEHQRQQRIGERQKRRQRPRTYTVTAQAG